METAGGSEVSNANAYSYDDKSGLTDLADEVSRRTTGAISGNGVQLESPAGAGAK